MAAAGHRVAVPRLPDTAAPRLEPWRKTYGEAVPATGGADSTVLVGRGIGAVNVPRFLEQYDPAEHARLFVQGLGATAVLTPTGGHFGATPDDRVAVPEAVRLVTELLAG
ncbi:hypothetical protein ACFV6F_31595 [Kitasatospora phosalacinea]|uniref:hypothetical protein n=1 Tax=Kitasatospora phosalacinea TaxID=2065 RepID=UPI00365A96EE